MIPTTMARKKASGRQTVAIVGTGNVARSLALGLRDAGIRITEIITRDEAVSRRKGATLAKQVKARAATVNSAQIDADIIWLCVSDGAIAEVAAQLAKLPVAWKGKSVLHASGSLIAAELSALKKRGAATASFHPMNTFVPAIKTDLRGTPFGAEGDAAAIRAGTELAKRLSAGATALVFRIQAKDKRLYHTIGAFTSPLTVSALNVAERIAKSIGIKQPERLMARILQSTVSNFQLNGTQGAFSGPVRRGDVATVKKHLVALKRIPGAEEVYRVLALNAVKHLPSKNQAELRKLLKLAKAK